jgi:hypothetical protein
MNKPNNVHPIMAQALVGFAPRDSAIFDGVREPEEEQQAAQPMRTFIKDIERTCPQCKGAFKSYRSDKKYCSEECRRLAQLGKTSLALAVLAALSIAVPAQAKFTAAGATAGQDQQIHAKKGGKAKTPKAGKTHKA